MPPYLCDTAEALDSQVLRPHKGAIGVPSMKELKRLIPYFRPYRRQIAAGLFFVVVSTAITSVIPWLLRQGIDSMSRGAALREVWIVAGAIVATSLIAGVMRYQMRSLMNGVSRWIEYDLRND